MSTHLWKYFLEDDVDNFSLLLANASHNASRHHIRPYAPGGSSETAVGSPGKIFATSPTASTKSKRSIAGQEGYGVKSHKKFGDIVLTRGDINSKDNRGITLLHLAASSTLESAPSFAQALLKIPLLDLYLQDFESGWTALHRALYFGNATIARALMSRDLQNAMGGGGMGGAAHTVDGLIKIKDREGNSPFDLFGNSITARTIPHDESNPTISAGAEDEDEEAENSESEDGSESGSGSRIFKNRHRINGDELFTFGSNKNLTLGFGDEDDRQYPERIHLKRPQHVLRRLQAEHRVQSRSTSMRQSLSKSDALSAIVHFRPITIQDVQLSKFHSAVITTDPEANLYVCGFGPGGRLGTGDEKTRFNFTPIYGGGLSGKKVIRVALGQNHTLAVSGEGELFTWGNNGFGQLGYSMPSSSAKDEDPVQLLPRQVFGSLKREAVNGIAASRLHSVAYTSTSLYTFGKNEGQLGLVDSDARSLTTQVTPRKVAASLFSSSISTASAIDKATVCLLENHEVWIFANYGYTKMSFFYDEISNFYLNQNYSMGPWASADNHICKIGAGGDTVCAMSKRGDVFTCTVSQAIEASPSTTSTTNPTKIRSALSIPQRIWSMRKGHMAVRDVDVGQDGSVIICTDSGSVWRRVKRAKIKDTQGAGSLKPKDYKFSRVPGVTRIAAVRSNAFGAFAAIRQDCDVLRTQINIAPCTLWDDAFPLLPFRKLAEEDSDTEEPVPRFWTPRDNSNSPATLRHAILQARNLEATIENALAAEEIEGDSSLIKVGTTTSKVLIPCHEFILAGRSRVLREALAQFRISYFFSVPDAFSIEYDKGGNIQVLFQGLNFLTIVNLVLYMYSDSATFISYNERMRTKDQNNLLRLVRMELMRLATGLELRQLEQAARLVSSPSRAMHMDLEKAVLDPEFFNSGDVEILLKDGSMRVHSALVCKRCPFFDGIFNGRAGGMWLADRRTKSDNKQEPVQVDLQHVTLEVFRLARQHIYADTEVELFDDMVASDEDAFLDHVLAILSIANELMLDRLSQICQKMLGKFVNMRNVCSLLNAVAPCSVTEFKNAALEYLCLNLEGMLENHYLDELDEDLMLELDQVIRDNQLARLPISKSGHAEARLLEDHPELIEIMERNKRAKIDSMALQSHFNEDDETKDLGPSKSKTELSGDGTPSPKLKAKSGTVWNRPSDSTSPALRAQRSMNDLMFPMHDLPEASLPDTAADFARPGGRKTFGPESSQPTTPQASLPRDDAWYDAKGKAIVSSPTNILPSSVLDSPSSSNDLQMKHSFRDSSSKDRIAGSPGVWRAASFTPLKLDMKDIFEQTSATRFSTLKSALTQQLGESRVVASPSTKLSQKERKKQLQQQQLSNPLQEPTVPTTAIESSPTPPSSSSAWNTAFSKTRVSLQDIFAGEAPSTPTALVSSTQRRPSPLTMRQTIPGNINSAKAPSTDPNPATRSLAGPHNPTSTRKSRPPLASSTSTPDAKLVPRSVRHTSLPAEPSLNLSMADILSQQQTEKDIIREVATAKRSLQEIQEEQAFQEWWDQESKKVQEEEEKEKGGDKRGRGKSRGRGRGGVRGERGGARGRALAQEGGEGRNGNDYQRGRGKIRALGERGTNSRGGERGAARGAEPAT